MPAFCAPAIVRSSTSVKFITCRTSVAEQILQRAAQDVDADERPEVADVPARVDRQAAGVHADGVVGARRERLLAAGQRVVEAHRSSGLGSGAGGAPLRLPVARDDDLELAGAGAELHVAAAAAAPPRRPTAPARSVAGELAMRGRARSRRARAPLRRRRSASPSKRGVVGQVEREEELVIGHERAILQ